MTETPTSSRTRLDWKLNMVEGLTAEIICRRCGTVHVLSRWPVGSENWLPPFEIPKTCSVCGWEAGTLPRPTFIGEVLHA